MNTDKNKGQPRNRTRLVVDTQLKAGPLSLPTCTSNSGVSLPKCTADSASDDSE